ncbi:TRAP transporter large permease [Hoeflea sp. CAU 1731]
MSLIAIGFLSIAAMLLLVGLGIPIAMAMAVVGIAGLSWFGSFDQAAFQLTTIAWETGTDFLFITAPMFILMGQLVYRADLAGDLYDCLQKWLGWLPGGLAIASVMACAMFAAITGVSAATVVTMGQMAMPEMRKRNYDPALSTGALAIAGTLGILIPPSILMVLFGIWTETSIGDLFIAGIVPGVLMTLGFALLILVRCLINPALGPVGPRFSWGDRFRSLVKLLPVFVVFGFVMGGIYGGVFTPTEASGFGAISVFLVGFAMRRFTWKKLGDALYSTVRTSGMIFLIIVGGSLLARFLAVTEISQAIVDVVMGTDRSVLVVLISLTLMYIVLGAILDVFGMLILTLPFVFPVVISLGINPVWFGVYLVIVTEIALVTPPVGINTFVMHSVARDVPLATIFRGVTPFVGVAVALLALMIAFPDVVLWLPGLNQ